MSSCLSFRVPSLMSRYIVAMGLVQTGVTMDVYVWSYGATPQRDTLAPHSPLSSLLFHPPADGPRSLKRRSLKVTATVTILCVLVRSLARLPHTVTRKHELLRP